jgi:drug/metabolite transporter (DMT)-like permease
MLRSPVPGLSLQAADVLLMLGMVSAAVAYAWGARLAGRMPPEQVICWALLISLPVSLPGTWLSWPTQAVGAVPWLALGYVSVFSMWLGFFAWYRGLALGGTVRVSQVQLLQPFMSLLVAVPLLGEQLDGLTLVFAAAVLATVLVGRKLASLPEKASP